MNKITKKWIKNTEGVYICKDCLKRYNLVSTHTAIMSPCLICGKTNDNWQNKLSHWVTNLREIKKIIETERS